jgi:hypothetical protein
MLLFMGSWALIMINTPAQARPATPPMGSVHGSRLEAFMYRDISGTYAWLPKSWIG